MNLTEVSNYQGIFNDIGDLLFITNSEGQILEVNNAVFSILGYSSHELSGKNILDLFPAKQHGKVKATIFKHPNEKRNFSGIKILPKNQGPIAVEINTFKSSWNFSESIIVVVKPLSELAFSEEKFYRIFNHNQTLMAILDSQSGQYINVNKTFLNSLGYCKSEVIGHTADDLKIFLDQKKHHDLLKDVSESNEVRTEEVKIRTKDGNILTCLYSASILQINEQNYFFTSGINITPLKDVERELNQNLQQKALIAEISQSFNSITKSTPKFNETLELIGNYINVTRMGIFEFDKKSHTATCNYEWCNPKEKISDNRFNKIDFNKHPLWEKLLIEEGEVFIGEMKGAPKEIKAFLSHFNIESVLALPLFIDQKFSGFLEFENGVNQKAFNPGDINFLKTVANITSNTFERIKYHTLLNEQKAQLKMAIENTGIGLWDWNILTGETYFNENWAQMLGFDPDELKPCLKKWREIVHPDDLPDVQEAFKKHSRGLTSNYKSIHRIKTKSGDWKWIMDSGKIISHDSEGNPARAIGIHVDIHHQKETENELRVANATKNKFFSIIAHDLRGPIASLLQISEVISQNENIDESTLKQFFNSQLEISKNTFDLLENLLSWARQNENQLKYKPRTIELNKIIDYCIRENSFRAKSKGITIVVNQTGPSKAFADEDMIKLTIRNLLSNAIKFSHENGTIELGIKSNEEHASFYIKDYGLGISQENIQRIFSQEEFFTTPGTFHEKGSGLGLMLCKTFVEQNKGQLNIDSEVNAGTTISFTLPIH
jgi:PAS domain S-box-containing protein